MPNQPPNVLEPEHPISLDFGAACRKDPPADSTDRDARLFIEAIQNQRQLGHGFVPIIGAGFSSPAGAPLIQEILPYLQRCICLAMGAYPAPVIVRDVAWLRPDRAPRWNPRTDQWPAFNDPTAERSSDIWKRTLDGLQSGDPDLDGHARGVAKDWRDALLFLSRVYQHEGQTRLGEPRREIIDACFREILKNKAPALNHRMLAALAGALRLDVILTTNFDNLLETAFARARNPLEVFDIPHGGALPDWSAVSSARSLIKLHGGKYSLRADYSLDGAPDTHNKDRFLEYLLSPIGRRQLAERSDQRLDFQNHVLMFGTTGEPRTLAFVEHAWDRLKTSFRVYWVCYSEEDVEAVKKFTRSYAERKGINTEEWCGSIYLRHTEVGLLLLQMYQMIRRNLPPMLDLFPAVPRLALPPSPPSRRPPLSKDMRTGIEQIKARINAFHDQTARGLRPNGLIVVTADPDAGGVTTVCGDAFRELQQKKVALWLDMNDIGSTDNLFEILLETARLRLGQEHWTPTYISDGKDEQPPASIVRSRTKQGREIERLTRMTNKPWVIFLNARETPGANFEQPGKASTNGWLDIRQTKPVAGSEDDSGHVDAFLDLVAELTKANCAVVLMCRADDRGQSELLAELGERDELFDPHPLPEGDYLRLRSSEENRRLFAESSICQKVLAWTHASPQKQRFVHALLLMQRPRFLATIWDPEIVPVDRAHPPAADTLLEWLDELEETGLVRRKPGGFIWLHSRSRQLMRRMLSGEGSKATPPDWPSIGQECEIHDAVARWYTKIIDVAYSPTAAFESVYHWCRSALPIRDEQPDVWRRRAIVCIGSSIAVLKANGFMIQTQGYSRGTCRKLEYIRTTLASSITHPRLDGDPQVGRAIERLRLVCTDIMRGIAREVGEDSKSYRRQREYGQILMGQDHHRYDKGMSRRIHRSIFGNSPERRRELEGEWPRWWRWCGMLAMASRSFDVADRALSRARAAALGEQRYLEREELRTLDAPLDMAKVRQMTQSQQLELLRVIEQQVCLKLCEQDTYVRAYAEGGRPSAAVAGKTTTPQWIDAQIRAGRDLAALIRAGDHSSEASATIKANWCESRLITHQSVSVSFMIQTSQKTKQQISQQAMGLLTEAEAVLRLSDMRRYRSDLALVELHRGDARLREAESSPMTAAGKPPMPFHQKCGEWLRLAQDPRIPLKKTALDRLREREELEPGLRRTRALLNDSLRFLHRAEPVLLERRRNVWWTTWFFERKLRVIAWSVWASVLEERTPVPFLGSEAAVSTEATAADRLLDDAQRMIRVDSYRLCTIIDAYASCLRALQVRMLFDVKGGRALTARRMLMKETLGDASMRLNSVIELRNLVSGEDEALSPDVLNAIEQMKARIKGTSHWIEQFS